MLRRSLSSGCRCRWRPAAYGSGRAGGARCACGACRRRCPDPLRACCACRPCWAVAPVTLSVRGPSSPPRQACGAGCTSRPGGASRARGPPITRRPGGPSGPSGPAGPGASGAAAQLVDNAVPDSAAEADAERNATDLLWRTPIAMVRSTGSSPSGTTLAGRVEVPSRSCCRTPWARVGDGMGVNNGRVAAPTCKARGTSMLAVNWRSRRPQPEPFIQSGSALRGESVPGGHRIRDRDTAAVLAIAEVNQPVVESVL